ncbi:MAG TPA: ABC-F family ATP-binding cassette domain-containing protein [Candidatus Methanoperedens sp.]|nr:ABC-F family ATP-binding cassette domain-containing protein [Candidatus Methanoperedens sp.]
MITLNHIAKSYGDDVLFKDLSLRIGDDERIAIVGPNGAGKSTLLKIILGIVDPDAGETVRSRSHTAGYLPQEGIAHAGKTLADETATAFDDLLAMHARADAIAREIDALAGAGKGDCPEVHELVDEMGIIQHHLEHREGWSIQAKVEEVLLGLGFKPSDLQRDTAEFSGGWQMRIALAKLLLREPTILMLDEPTNHLDIESLTWLEEYLRSYDGSVVVISHDRRFLDNLTRRTIEIAGGKASEYKGNYSYYLKEREIRLEMLRASYENQQEQIRATMAFVDRFRYQATKARQVQSRLKQLDKIERIELDEEQGGISFDFPPPPAPGRVLMRLEGVTKAYGPQTVFTGLDLTLERGDRIAFLGSNGAGKSTLARIIAGLEPIQAGTRTPGHNAIISYYAQHQADELEPKKTVLETLEDAAPAGLQQGLRRLLGCFLFTGDDVFKRVAVLSGGEKSRLALAKMLLTPANLLILDEPTNHLDVRSKGVLQEALRRFAGSYCIVSHDRDFLEPLATKVFEFRDGRTTMFLGGVSDWLEKLRREREAAQAAARKPAPAGPARPRNDGTAGAPPKAAGAGARQAGKAAPRPAPATPAAAGKPGAGEQARPGDKDRRRREAERRQERSRRLRPLQSALDKLEKKVAAAEARKREVEAALGDPAVCALPERVAALSEEYRELTTSLAYLYDDWGKTQEELEKADRETAG